MREFSIYKHLLDKYGIEPDNIEHIDEKRTYKKFIEYTVFLISGEVLRVKTIAMELEDENN